MRKEVPEIGWGDFTIIPSGQREVLIIRYDWRDNSVLFIHNFGAMPREITFSLRLGPDNAARRDVLINLLSEDHSRAGRDGRHRMVVEGYGYHWYRVGGLDYLLRRTESDRRTANRKGARASAKARR
jgi:maltose alpha-D-glucosyltransferase / alpha-amylase